MVSLASNFVNNLSELIHRIKCKWDTTIKNVKHVELNISIVNVVLSTQHLMMI